MLFNLAVMFVSFFVGFAMKKGGLCTYAAVVQIVHDKRMEKMMIFLGVAAWATLIILPLHWIIPSEISLSFTHYSFFIALFGGMVLGIGAFLNKGCFFGTFVALVSGNINYIATLFGLSAGVAFTQMYISSIIPTTSDISYVNEPMIGGYVWLAVMVLFALFMAFSVKLNKDNFLIKMMGLDVLTLQSVFAMMTIGLGGALLYATVSGWNYSDVLTNTTSMLIGTQEMGASFIALLSTFSLLAGGIVAAVTAREFSISKVRFSLISGCFVGGALMGSSSMFIPGGNDGFLLKGIPGLASHALLGYLTMILSMWALVYIFRNKRT